MRFLILKRTLKSKFMFGLATFIVIFTIGKFLPEDPFDSTSEVLSLKIELEKPIVVNENRSFIIFAIPSLDTVTCSNLRHSIRSRWMNYSFWNIQQFEKMDPRFLKFKLMFVIGKSKLNFSEEVLEEASQHDDMFLAPELSEGSNMLRYKVMWSMKKSLALFDYDYLVKVDHDTLIDLPALIKGLMKQRRYSFYGGFCNLHVPKRKKYEDLVWFQYCQGGGYILSRDLVEKITLEDQLHTNVPITPEDLYTGWLVYNIELKSKARRKIRTTIRHSVRLYRKNYVKLSVGFWFLHWLKDPEVMEEVFQCRTSLGNSECTRSGYNITSKTCQCSLPKPLELEPS